MNDWIIKIYHWGIISGFWLAAFMMLTVVVLYGKVWVCEMTSNRRDGND